MQIVQPKVYLVGGPQVYRDALQEFLAEIGAPDWLDRKPEGYEDGELLAEVGGRLCYRSFEIGLNPNITRIREDEYDYHGNVLKSGHGSVIEHPNYTFIAHQVSRILTHELVRHRAGVAISQESMRFVRLDDIPMWFPEWAKRDPDLMAALHNFVMESEDLIRFMADRFKLDDPATDFAEKKAKTSFMRRFAPAGHATSIMVTINVRALRHIIYMRTALGAEEEIRLVCDDIAVQAQRKLPNLMQDYSPNEDREWVPQWLKV